MDKKKVPIEIREKPFVSRMMEKLAPIAGVKVLIEPKYGYVGQIICPNGKKHYYRNTHFDLNPLESTEICKDKDYTSFFLSSLGYPVIEGRAFFSKKWCEAIGEQNGIDQAYQYARSLKFPVIVKPNSKSQGVGVYRVTTKSDFYSAMHRIFKIDNVALVQKLPVAVTLEL